MTGTNNNFSIIMAGGVGSRFWPVSKQHHPKQFLDIMGTGQTLIQQTFSRIKPIMPEENIFVVTNQKYLHLVKEQLPSIPQENIVCEPSPRNTAPCIAYGTYKILQKCADPNIVVLPSDHLILDEAVFLEKAEQCLRFVSQDNVIATIGIKPTRPDTGYGYIHYSMEQVKGFYEVKKFTEKPNEENAKKFIQSGDHLWNAGIFIWSGKTLIEAYKTHLPHIYHAFEEIKNDLNTNKETDSVNRIFPHLEEISVDYGIIEKVDNIYTTLGTFRWSDLGTWSSLHAVQKKDENDNVVMNNELVHLIQTKNCFVNSEKDKLVVLNSVNDLLVIQKDDIIFICNKNKEQEVKQVLKLMKEKYGDTYS